MAVNFVDFLLALLVLLSVVHGWQRGFLHGLLDLVRWAAGLMLGLRYYQRVAGWLADTFDWSSVWYKPVAFLLTAAAVGIVVQLVGQALLGRLSKDVHEGKTNRLLGTLPGAAGGLVFAAITSALLLAMPLPETLRESARESTSVNRLAALAEDLETVLSPIFDEAVAHTLNKLTVRPESGESVELPFKVAVTRPRPELEAEMLNLVNRERAAAGLRAVAPDPEMTEVARRHSVDMFARGYFSHVTPEGRSPFDRMNEGGIVYRTAGENLALAPTLTIAHTGLMNSPGHRANILRPEFGRLGIGIVDGGARGLMVTQNFRN